jgi:hypothetical protein
VSTPFTVTGLYVEECHCTHCGHHFARNIKQSEPPKFVQYVPFCYVCEPASAKRQNPYGAWPVKASSPPPPPSYPSSYSR